MTRTAEVDEVPIHTWVVRAVFGVSAEEAAKISAGSKAVGRPIVESFVRYEGPNCLMCGAVYEERLAGADCPAAKRTTTKVKF